MYFVATAKVPCQSRFAKPFGQGETRNLRVSTEKSSIQKLTFRRSRQRIERASNVHVRDGADEDAFVAVREARDATLAMPARMLPSIQINIRAGRLPPNESNGTSYLKLPVNLL